MNSAVTTISQQARDVHAANRVRMSKHGHDGSCAFNSFEPNDKYDTNVKEGMSTAKASIVEGEQAEQ